MALQTWKCLECEKTFSVGEWDCAVEGVKHKVNPKQYFMDDAPTHVELKDGKPYINKGTSRTVVLNVPPERKVRDGDDIRIVPGGSVEFVRGTFTTDDPEIQFYLEKKKNLCDEKRWYEVYLTDDEKHALKHLEDSARIQRLENEKNDLLKMMQEQQKRGPGRPPKAKENEVPA